MKKPSLWLIPLGLWVFVSSMATSLGVMRLLDVKNEIRGTAERARLTLDAGNAAVVSFVPGGEGTVTVGRTGKTASTEDAIALLTFRSQQDSAVAVFDGTDARTLERGAGRATDTAEPNAKGRCVLHGHRDSAFAPLAKLQEGDKIVLETAGETVTYQVTDIFVTEPTDPAIYKKSDHRQLALVTCYPFTFVGPAPDRCVVVADEVDS